MFCGLPKIHVAMILLGVGVQLMTALILILFTIDETYSMLAFGVVSTQSHLATFFCGGFTQTRSTWPQKAR